MSTYSARVEVADGMLHVSRPLTAPDEVGDVVDSVVFAVRNGDGSVSAIALQFETVEESQTPIGDSVTGTSSTPVVDDLPADVDVPGTAPAGVTA